ncbi:hypothetical protein EW146_g5502 [Bondarzewia mesenterica]|uniref:Uncharacterized protein n=1 Tax=Bondarzewia mesenterica TaxID=1095465 RepID=A0A4S4LT56_9AGAM|nr:hypothetical protein EW146_g5502 [Bondarzewia mesenterica]
MIREWLARDTIDECAQPVSDQKRRAAPYPYFISSDEATSSGLTLVSVPIASTLGLLLLAHTAACALTLVTLPSLYHTVPVTDALVTLTEEFIVRDIVGLDVPVNKVKVPGKNWSETTIHHAPRTTTSARVSPNPPQAHINSTPPPHVSSNAISQPPTDLHPTLDAHQHSALALSLPIPKTDTLGHKWQRLAIERECQLRLRKRVTRQSEAERAFRHVEAKCGGQCQGDFLRLLSNVSFLLLDSARRARPSIPNESHQWHPLLPREVVNGALKDLFGGERVQEGVDLVKIMAQSSVVLTQRGSKRQDGV